MGVGNGGGGKDGVGGGAFWGFVRVEWVGDGKRRGRGECGCGCES